MSFLEIAAEDVRIGDQLYMGKSFAKNPNHRYVSIKIVKKSPLHNNPSDSRLRIMIRANGVDYWYEPKEIVSIQRFD